MTVFAAPPSASARSSSGEINRPALGESPSSSKKLPETNRPDGRGASPSTVASTGEFEMVRTSRKTEFSSRMRSKIGYEKLPTCPYCVMRPSSTRSCGEATRRLRSRSVSTREKIAVLAPTPSASESAATAVNPGLRRIDRRPWRTSRTRSSRSVTRRWSRHRSSMFATLPNSARARRRASAGDRPFATCASISRRR